MSNLTRLKVALVAFLGLLLALLIFTDLPDMGRSPVDAVFFVTTPADGGPGSLRSAIFGADRATVQARIVLQTEFVELTTPLPPLINPEGIVLESEHQRTELRVADLGPRPVLDLAAEGSVVRGIEIRNAAGPGILVRSDRVQLERVTLVDCVTGVHVAANVDRMVLLDSRLDDNETGVRIESAGTGLRLESNEFARNRTAIAAIAPRPGGLPLGGQPLRVKGNTFEEDQTGVLVSSLAATIDQNRFARIGGTAIHVATSTSRVLANQILDGRHTGILLDGTVGAAVIENEVGRNEAIGIHLRSARNSSVRTNHLYSNGYGITTMYDQGTSPNVVADNLVVDHRHDGIVVLAGAPILRSNRVLRSGVAGIRLLDMTSADGPTVEAQPLLSDNTLSGNQADDPVRAVFDGGGRRDIDG